MSVSYVVTGGGKGIGRAVVERLLDGADQSATVVPVEFDPCLYQFQFSPSERTFDDFAIRNRYHCLFIIVLNMNVRLLVPAIIEVVH